MRVLPVPAGRAVRDLAAEEYAKLPAYDRETMGQPPQVFLCHQNERDSDRSRVCAG